MLFLLTIIIYDEVKKKDIVSEVCIPNQFLMTGTIFHHHMVPGTSEDSL